MLALALLHAGEFSWSDWRLYPDFLIGWLLFGGVYFLAAGPLRRHFPGSSPVPLSKVASFTLAMLIMLVSLQGPLHELSDYFLFSAHMVQHLLLGMYALVVFTLTFLATASHIFAEQAPRLTDETRAGFDLVVDSNAANPVSVEQLEARPGVADAVSLLRSGPLFTADFFVGDFFAAGLPASVAPLRLLAAFFAVTDFAADVEPDRLTRATRRGAARSPKEAEPNPALVWLKRYGHAHDNDRVTRAAKPYG